MIGIGFGPSNVALAIALDELAASAGRQLSALFLERQSDYSWHGPARGQRHQHFNDGYQICYSRFDCRLGAPMTVIGTLRYRF